MLRTVFPRVGLIATVVAVLALGSVMTSCGGGGTGAKEMKLVQLLYVDRSLDPTAATGTDNLPRNAQVLMVFSELVNSDTVNDQTVQIRFGPQFQSVPAGSFSVTGNEVRFDPTVTEQGQPNPFGFDPVTQHTVDIPNFEEQDGVVENLDFDPNLSSFFTTFTTSDGFLRELKPPSVLGITFVPERDPLTKNVPGQALMAIEFDEPMWPGSFIQGPATFDPTPPDAMLPESTTIDIRYDFFDSTNTSSIPAVNGSSVPGTFSHNPGATVYFFKPTFSWGDKKFVFNVQLFQGLTDLSGNLLVNPRGFGPYTCDGRGIATGLTIQEDFIEIFDTDFATTDADWGQTEEGVLQGQPITSRDTYVYGYWFANNGGPAAASGNGQYAPVVDPLVGADLNNFIANINPPTSQGRRVMWAFSDVEMGAKGAVTAAAWGPDSNATFAATYEDIKLRAGFQKDNTISLAESFLGNYEGSPAIVYSGDYQVTQAANVGNHPDHPLPGEGHVGGYTSNQFFAPCLGAPNWNQPLFDFTGWFAWPELTTFFEWEPGDPNIDNDRAFLFDASVPEGDSFQQIRSWFSATFPCSGVLIGGFPNRRLYSTYEDDSPNPPANFFAGILNPEPSVQDTCFTITRRTSVGQSLFYTPNAGGPNDDAAWGGRTLGLTTDYLPAEIEPIVQSGGATVLVEFQGCQGIDPTGRDTVNVALPFTEWTQDIDDCDGMPYIRWRITLSSNLKSQTVARITRIIIPMIDNS